MPDNTTWDDVDAYGLEFWNNFQYITRTLYQPLGLALMALGALGNLAGLITFFRGKTLQTPHFYFYKMLSIAELTCNLNFIVVHLFDATCALAEPQAVRLAKKGHLDAWTHAYSNPVAATYQGIISRVLASGMGYVIMYMALEISLDRCAAVWFPMKYREVTNAYRKRFNSYAIATAVFLAFAFHSWPAFVENELHDVRDQNTNATFTFIRRRDHADDTVMMHALLVKDYYNAAIRVIYLVLLLALTAAVIVGFLRIERQRVRMGPPQLKVPSPKGSPSRHNSQSQHRRKVERSLLGLMVAVVLLAFLQVVPTELRRLLNAIYSETEADKIANNKALAHADRLAAVNVYFLGHQALKYAGNVATLIDRSLKFYLYVLLNKQVRREALNVWCVCMMQNQRRSHTGYSVANNALSRSTLNVNSAEKKVSSTADI